MQAAACETKEANGRSEETRKHEIPLLERAALNPTEVASLFGKKKGWAYKRIYEGTLKRIEGLPEILVSVSEVKKLMGRSIPHTGVS